MTQYRYEFPADRTGKAGAVKPYRGEKTDFVTPVSNLSGVAELLTNAALKATEAYSQYGQDRLGAVLISKIKGWAYSDRGGTLYVEESDNNHSWSTTASADIGPGVLTATEWVYLTKRYYRFRYVNGNLQQSEFVLYQSVGAGEVDVHITEAAPLPITFEAANTTEEGRLKVEGAQVSTKDFVFHENAENAGEGAVLTVGTYKKLLVEIYGTAEKSEVNFWGRSFSGANLPIQGKKTDNGEMSGSTSGKAEAWIFDMTGYKEIVMEIAEISGGSLSVKGTAVS
ncbi:phage portal protein [Bacillus atrophaeus]|uniref:phage-like element PBSX protein XepA n=1 Tax=Bacillus atrophaeus TaxID=1452 RepID=UPI003873B9E0